MADTTTTVLGLVKPEVGASTDTWGPKYHSALDAIDALFDTGAYLKLSKGGTGSGTAAGARTNLGLGTLATLSSVGSTQITDASVTTAKIADDAVTNAKIGLLAVGTAEIADDAITNAKIGLLAVGTAEIADDAVTNAKIGALAVGTTEIAAGAVTTAKIAASAITATELASDAVTTAKILNSNVTTAKIADDAVTAAKIVAGAVGTAEVADAAITPAKLSGAQSGSAPAFAARAWANINGGSATLRGSGNVASVTENATGDFTVTFTTAMADVNYAAIITAGDASSANNYYDARLVSKTTSAVRFYIHTQSSGNPVKTSPDFIDIVIFR